MTIALIVDDNPITRRNIERYLEGRGVAFHVATDPRATIQRLKRKNYDFLFLDLNLGAGIQDGEGILAWMDRHQLLTPTLIISEAAALPAVIRLEHSYGHIVRFRMTHGDLAHLADLVDELMTSLINHQETERSLDAPKNFWRDAAPLLAIFLILTITISIAVYYIPEHKLAALFSGIILVLVIIFAVLLLRTGNLKEKSIIQIALKVLDKVPGLGHKSP